MKKIELEVCHCERCGETLLLPKNEAIELEKGNNDCPYCNGEIVCDTLEEEE